MADEIDFANDLIDNEISRALNKIRESSAQDASITHFCIMCGDNIPLGRKKLGFKLCISCAQEKERKKQLFAE